MMSESVDEQLLEAVATLVPALLGGLAALAHAGRYLHPAEIGLRAAEIQPVAEPLAGALDAFKARTWPAGLQPFRDILCHSAELTLEGIRELGLATMASEPVPAAYRALGHLWRANEALYPLADSLAPIGRHFLSPSGRSNSALAERLAVADHQRPDAGVMHADNAPGMRGGFSLYVPEYQRADEPLPLIVALHGGAGHGRGFLWSWLRDARSSGCMVLAPTARGDTWPLLEQDDDSAVINRMIDRIDAQWPIDRSRVLLAGMSDGATFSWILGLPDGAPYTHLAPVAGTFHPMLLEAASPERLHGLPVYLVHGALDWMFPIDVARMARDALVAAGAALEYREIADLAHTWPQEESSRILDWFLRR